MNEMIPSTDKLKAIIEAPSPTTTDQLGFLLGIITFYAKFVLDRSHLLKTLHMLIKLKVAGHWNATCEAAFEEVKTLFATAPILVLYDMHTPHKLECDASPYGVGVVLTSPPR